MGAASDSAIEWYKYALAAVGVASAIGDSPIVVQFGGETFHLKMQAGYALKANAQGQYAYYLKGAQIHEVMTSLAVSCRVSYGLSMWVQFPKCNIVGSWT